MPDATRVLIVHEVLGQQGGAEGCVADGAAALRAAGIPVALLHEGRTGHNAAAAAAGFTATWNGSTPDGIAAARAWQPQVLWVHSLRAPALLTELLAWNLPVLRTVHDHASYCLREYRYFPWSRRICTRTPGWGCALTCSVLRNRHGPLPVRLGWPGRKIREMRAWARCHRHLANSHYMAEEIARAGVARDRIEVLHPCPPPPTEGCRSDHATCTAVFTGQLIRGKGCDQFVSACAALRTPGWSGVVIGDGPLRGSLESMANRLGLGGRLRFLGRVPRAELSTHYRHARVGVVPGMWPEPLGLTGIEFLQHGIPVVAYPVGGTSDWLRDGDNGLAASPGDPGSLAAAMDRLLGDPALAARMGEAGRIGALAAFDRARYLDRVISLLRTPSAWMPGRPCT